VTAFDALEDVRYGRRQEKFGGIVYKTVRACLEAYLRHVASVGTAPMLELTASDLVRWRVELGVPRLDDAAASRVLHAWHRVIATLRKQPREFTAEQSGGGWVIVQLRDQHHDRSHVHRFWVEVTIEDAAGTRAVLQRRKDRMIGLRELVPNAVKKASDTAEQDEDAPQSQALAEVSGFVGSFIRDASGQALADAHSVLRLGRRRGWSRPRIAAAIIAVIATACGLWHWYRVHYTYSTPLVSRSGPLIDWGSPGAGYPVFWLGKRVGYVAYDRTARDTIHVRYFSERPAWCPTHKIVKDIFTWRLSKNGRAFYTITTAKPWCEIRRTDLPDDPINLDVEMRDGAEVTFKATRASVAEIVTLQPERAEPVVIVTTTEGQGDLPAMTEALSTTTQVTRRRARWSLRR